MLGLVIIMHPAACKLVSIGNQLLLYSEARNLHISKNVFWKQSFQGPAGPTREFRLRQIHNMSACISIVMTMSLKTYMIFGLALDMRVLKLSAL